jgi:EF-P beta-lysylation protein EpmB
MLSPPLWRQILRTNFIKWHELADFLGLSPEQRNRIDSKPGFPLNLPRRLAEKIAKQTLEDPILRQFLPTIEEKRQTLGFVSDPVGDSLCSRSSKLLHKYHGRVLLVCTSACAMHCRYCFRQQFDYDTGHPGFSNEIELIRQDTTLQEVILSGGDPLSLSDQVLESLLQELALIPHVRRIRFHTRFPIGIPERIDGPFLAILENVPKQIWFIVHANHPEECDPDVLAALKRIQKLGIPVCNQAVLLKGVNDDVDTLCRLCEKLTDHGILPYYLHQLDKVQGAAHFEVSEAEGLMLIKKLTARLPGYGVPKYVKEIAGEPAKTPIPLELLEEK